PKSLGVRVGIPVQTTKSGAVDAAATMAGVAELAATGVTAVSVALGRSVRTRADIEPYLRDLVTALRA
ncbi:MAG: hypothetical protein ABJC79_10455, partial [Acidimicrobiia bacterium]